MENEEDDKEDGLNWALSVSDIFVIGALILGITGIICLVSLILNNLG